MGKMVEIRTRTKISLAQQVRDAVKYHCVAMDGIKPQRDEYQIKSELKFMVVKEAMKVKIKSPDIAYEKANKKRREKKKNVLQQGYS